MLEISPLIENMPPSGIRAFFDLVLSMKDIISLGVGEPDFDTPWHISQEAIDKIEKGYNCYTSNSGLLELRKEISTYMEKKYSISYDPETEILITVGVSEAMDLAFRSLKPGSKVLFIEPAYVAYEPIIRMAGCEPVPVTTSQENGFKITPEILECYKDADYLFFNYPSNPSGATYSKDELLKITEFSQRNDIFIISDEIYHQLTFDFDHTALASLPGMKDNSLHLNGFSKGFAMTGWRIGFACGPEKIIKAMTKIHQYTILCAPTISQFAAVEALKNGDSTAKKMKDDYCQRRNFILKKLAEIGISCHKPGGAFYLFPEVPKPFKNGEEFASALLKQEKVAVVPGEAFNSPTHFRISYASSMKNLKTAMDKIEKFLQNC